MRMLLICSTILAALLLADPPRLYAQQVTATGWPTGSTRPEWKIPSEPRYAYRKSAAFATPGSLPELEDRRNRRRNALIGAGIGALVGGVAGVYMDSQVQDRIAPPSWLVTVPVGAGIGALIGALVR